MLASQEHVVAIDAPAVQEKSPVRAQFLAIAHSTLPTAVGLALMSWAADSDLYAVPRYGLMAYGIVCSPSMGNFYARSTPHH